VNAARQTHRALQRDSGLRFLPVDNDQIIAWAKLAEEGTDLVIGVVNLDPDWVQSGYLQLGAGELGVELGATFPVRDVLTGESYLWQSGRNFVRLDPAGIPAHLLALEPR